MKLHGWRSIVAAVALSMLTTGLRAEVDVSRLLSSPRLKVEQADALQGVPSAAGAVKVVVAFSFIDPAGKPQIGKGKILIPAAIVGKEGDSAPLAYSAGYELPDAGAGTYLEQGMVVATPLATELNPMSRLPNLDAAFLAAVRSLEIIDDAKVVIFGGSAGGYTTLMLCARTFPVTAAVPHVPPINWGYNVKYFQHNQEVAKAPDGQPPQKARVPGVAIVGGMILAQHTSYYPPDLEDRGWYLNSPISQLDTITNPVLMIFSTADVLVPIHQVGAQLVRPHEPSAFPAGFEADPQKLMTRSEGRQTLLEKLSPEQYTLKLIPADPDWPDLAEAGGKQAQRKARQAGAAAPATLSLPFDGKRQWEIVVVDEGPMAPQAGHFRHVFLTDSSDYIQSKLDAGIAPDQLTARKLERLMTRYAGVEWLESGLRALDEPQWERADVIRGLVTYTSQGEAHARRFIDLYRALPRDRQALGPADQFADAARVRTVLQSLR